MQGVGVRWRKLLSIAAGPAANLLTGTASLWAGLGMIPSASLTATHFYATHALLFYALVSFFLGLSNLLPVTFASGHRSDGQQLLDLFRRKPQMERHLAWSVLLGSSYAGTRPRQWDASWLPVLLANADGSVMDFLAHCLAYTFYVDSQHIEQAHHHLREARQLQHLVNEGTQQHLLSEEAYLAAVFAHDSSEAKNWLGQAEQVGTFEGKESYFIRATVACAAGEISDASKWLRACEADPHLGDANDQGGRLFAVDRLAALRLQVHRLEQDQKASLLT